MPRGAIQPHICYSSAWEASWHPGTIPSLFVLYKLSIDLRVGIPFTSLAFIEYFCCRKSSVTASDFPNIVEKEVLVLVLSYAWTNVSTLGRMHSLGNKQTPTSSWGLGVQSCSSLVRTTVGFMQPSKFSWIPWKEPGKAFSLHRVKRPEEILLLVSLYLAPPVLMHSFGVLPWSLWLL